MDDEAKSLKDVNGSVNIAVCDDQGRERALIIAMLREYLEDRDIEAELFEYESGEALAADFTAGRFDLIFLDIYMGGDTGIETARKLKKTDPECLIVFATTSSEHGADAFEVDAFYYVVKPVERKKFNKALDKWYDRMCAVRTLDVKCGRSSKRVYLRDILYIDVLGRNCTVHTVGDCIQTTMPLAAVEQLLPIGEFCRPIRYCLASMRHIQAIRDDGVIMEGGEKLPISRLEKDALRRQLAGYRLRTLRGR